MGALLNAYTSREQTVYYGPSHSHSVFTRGAFELMH